MKATHTKGSITIELLIAFAILTLSLTAVIVTISGEQSASVDTQLDNDALYRAQSMLESARAQSRSNFSSVGSTGSTIETSGGVTYTKKLDVMDLDAFSKQATSTVTWQDRGRTLSVVLSTILSNPSTALGGDTCSQVLTGDWTNPQLMGSADVGQNNGGTDVDVLNKKAYVTADASSPAKGDFYIVDVSDPSASNLPILNGVNGLDTGPGLAAVRVAGKYAYVANISTVSQLQVIDISNPASPFIATSLKVIPAGDTAVGNSIFYDNKKIYLGLTKSNGPEFFVIDVSNPLSPTVLASYEVNSAVNEIREKNGVAYLAVPDDPSTTGTAEQLKVLDVSKASLGSITAYSSFSGNPSTMSGEGLYVSKDGNTVYLGEGGPSGPTFFVTNVSNPNSVTQIAQKDIGASVNAIEVRNNLAFLWTSDPNLGFQIWDLNNLSNPTPYGSLNTQQTATGGLDCEGNYIYTAQRSQKALQIIGPYMSQPFDYSFSTPADVTVMRAGSSQTTNFTVSRTSGASQPVTFSNSSLPGGVSMSYSASSCSPNCASTLTLSAADTATLGTSQITITGVSPTHTTSFNLTVVAPAFTYTMPQNVSNMTLIRGGSSVVVPITVTMAAGAQPQSVTVTAPNPAANPADLVIAPAAVQSCTPSQTSPYTCTIMFTYKASATATKKTYSNVLFTDTPNSVGSNKFKLTVN